MTDQSLQHAYGNIIVHSFSGFLIVDRNQEFAIETVVRGPLRIEILPPVRLAPPSWRPIPQFTNENLKRIIPSAPDNITLLRLTAFPQIEEDGKISVKLIWGDEEEYYGSLPPDTIMSLVYGDGAMSAQKVVADLIEEIFSWLRVVTRQWWLGRPTEAITGNAHLNIPMSGERNASGQPVPTVKQTTAFADTEKITATMWSEVIERVRLGRRPRTSDLFLSDATYLLIVGEVRAAIVIFCGAIELARDEALDRRGVSKAKLRSGATDVLKHLSVDFGALLGRNLRSEAPALYDSLKTLWICRGHLAHGQRAVWREGDKNVDFPQGAVAIIPDQVRAIISWIQAV
jgi:hypothetical protein